MTHEVHDLEARLTALEAQNRRLKRTGRAVAFVLGGLTLMSFAAPALCDIVWAERFVLRDASNRTRVTFNAYGTDSPTMTLHDARGRDIAKVGLTPEGTLALSVVKKGKALPASLEMTEEGELRFAEHVPGSGAGSGGGNAAGADSPKPLPKGEIN